MKEMGPSREGLSSKCVIIIIIIIIINLSIYTKGKRNIGRPKKRWRDQLHFEDQGKGNTPNPSET